MDAAMLTLAALLVLGDAELLNVLCGSPFEEPRPLVYRDGTPMTFASELMPGPFGCVLPQWAP